MTSSAIESVAMRVDNKYQPCFEVENLVGWDVVLFMVMPSKWYAKRVAKRILAKHGGARSFALPNGEVWGIDPVVRISGGN